MSLKNILIVATFFITLLTYSQESFRYGIKAGGNISGLRTKESANSGGTGFHIGAIAEYPINEKIALSAELLYNKKGGSYRVSTTPFITIDANLNYISVPVLAKINIVNDFKFEIGPEVSFLISENYEVDGTEITEFAEANKLDLAMAGGLSYEFNNGLFIQGRYSYGLSKIYEERDYWNTCITLSLGYLFN